MVTIRETRFSKARIADLAQRFEVVSDEFEKLDSRERRVARRFGVKRFDLPDLIAMSKRKSKPGKAAIEKFWDAVIGPSKLDITVDKRWTSGDRCCCVAQVARNDLGDGNYSYCDMLALYQVNDQGLITRMAAHWDFDEMMEQLKKLHSA